MKTMDSRVSLLEEEAVARLLEVHPTRWLLSSSRFHSAVVAVIVDSLSTAGLGSERFTLSRRGPKVQRRRIRILL